MAERFDSWPDGMQTRRGPRGGSKYDAVDWERFFDGGVYRITEDDFDSPKAFGATFRIRANKAGRNATVINAFNGTKVTDKDAKVNEVWVCSDGAKVAVTRKPKAAPVAETPEDASVPEAPAFAG